MRDLISAVRDPIGYLKGKRVRGRDTVVSISSLFERQNEVSMQEATPALPPRSRLLGKLEEVGDRPYFTLKTSFVSVRRERARGIGCESNLCNVHSCPRDWGKQLAYTTFQGLSRAKTSLFRNGQAYREYVCTSNIV